MNGKPSGRVVVQRVADGVRAVRIVRKAVRPAVVPLAAFSSTVSAAPSVSLIAVIPDSFTSVTAIVKFCVENEPSELVARMVTEWLVAVS